MKAILLTSLFFSLNSFAWGPIGHRVVGEIASKHLSAKAAKEVKALLGNESLAIVSNWPDFVKSDKNFQHASPWHYVTVEEGKTYAETEKAKEGDVVEGIGRMVKTLQDKKATKEARAEALKFLVHFVGDIHQPLHVGKGDDRGGNDVKVKWFEKETNLHHVWDEDLIVFQQLSYTEYTAMVNHATKAQIKQWQADDLNVIIKENMELRPLVYDLGEKKLSYDYNFKVIKVLNERLLKGGIRLAGILNQALK